MKKTTFLTFSTNEKAIYRFTQLIASFAVVFLLSFTGLSAQQNWVGNTPLVSSEEALTVLKTEMQNIEKNPGNYSPSSKAASSTLRGENTLVYKFYSSITDFIIIDDKSTKASVNSAANALIAQQYPEATVQTLVQGILPKLTQ